MNSKILFTNATFYLESERTAKNLLVVDGKVAAWNVADADQTGCEIVNLNGATVYPGFIDSHVHLLETGFFIRTGCNMNGCTTADEMAAKLEEHARKHPDAEILLGLGFSPADYDKWSLADLAKIDQASDGKKALLVDKLGHNAVINSAAIAHLGLTPQSVVPRGGKMIAENGQLTGMLRESAMTFPFSKLSELFDPRDIKAGMKMLADQWAATGYTGIVDLMGAPGIRLMYPELMKELEKEGSLSLRVNYCYTIFNADDIDAALKYRGQDTPLVRFLGLKIFVDGAVAGGEAWTSWPHENGGYGLRQIYDNDEGGESMNIHRIIAKAERHGLNFHYHVQGDQAIEVVLNSLDDVVKEKGHLDGVHTLIHLAFPTDRQIERIKGFGGKVVSTVQPGFWPVEEGMDYFYGEWADKAYPVKKLFDAGVSVGLSSDFSVSPPEYSPSMVIAGVALTGGGNPDVHPPLSVKDVIKGFSEGSAATTGFADIGKLDIGYYADMLVYETALADTPPAEVSLSNPKLLSTWVGGKKVYKAS